LHSRQLAAVLCIVSALALAGPVGRVGAEEHDPHAHMDHGDDHASMDQGSHGGHMGHGAHEPVGVMAGHMLEEPLSFMLGYRYQYARTSGDVLRGSTPASDMEIMANACQPAGMCMMAPETMSMQMHMIEFMFAPTSWLNFMIMPHFMSMDMAMRPLQGSPMRPGQSSTGGVGDLRMDVLLQLLRKPGHRLHMGLGVTAPTGSVSETRINPMTGQPVITHYGMQLGSGTWDLVPTLTYSGHHSKASWGAQVEGVARLEDRNDSGYRLGHRATTHLWGGFAPTSWLNTTLRMSHRWQGAIEGAYSVPHPTMSPPDLPSNYGGHFLDMGFGLQFSLPAGFLDDHSIGVEWAQPLYTDFNGYQLERVGALNVGWMVHF